MKVELKFAIKRYETGPIAAAPKPRPCLPRFIGPRIALYNPVLLHDSIRHPTSTSQPPLQSGDFIYLHVNKKIHPNFTLFLPYLNDFYHWSPVF
jgi:hypothetical protein